MIGNLSVCFLYAFVSATLKVPKDIVQMVKSLLSPKIEIRTSIIHGVGMFATDPIESKEIVFIHGGHIVTRDELFFSKVIGSYLPLDDNYFIGAKSKEEEKAVELFVNHSCSPNCFLRGEITFIAMRDIQVGEELTIDYATIDNVRTDSASLTFSRQCIAYTNLI